MTVAELRSYVDASPFERFIIHLADGRQVAVNHREFIFLPPVGRIVHVYEADGTLHVLDLYLITGIEIKQSKNGSRKRRRE